MPSPLQSNNPEVRAALALGTQAVQEVQAQAQENQRKAVDAAIATEQARAAERLKLREQELLDRLAEIAEQEQIAAVAKAVKETEERCAREASEWVKTSLAQGHGVAASRQKAATSARVMAPAS